MQLSFYYHTPIVRINKLIYAPSYLSVFINELSKNVEILVLLMHEATDSEIVLCDGLISNKNVVWVNLGSKTAAWHRVLFANRILRDNIRFIEESDLLLIRAPTPLGPYFEQFRKKIKVVYMIVGDYGEVLNNIKSTSIRRWLIRVFLSYNNMLFMRRIKNADVVVNSTLLLKKYKSNSKTIHEIRTTTLSENDFYVRDDTCQSSKVNLLYTGRLDVQKGLFEFVEATAILLQKGYTVNSHIVGWETNEKEPIKKALISYAADKGISKMIIFHGRKKVGEELNEMYRMGDIYVLPTYHEGFPRTIWEAMGNSLPVISTQVGAIPDFLKNNQDALLVEPKNVMALCQGIERLLADGQLRQKMIKNGQSLAKENTLEFQTKILINILEHVAKT